MTSIDEMGRARIDWRKVGVTAKTRGGAKEFRIYKAQAQKLPCHGKLPTQMEVSLAVSYELHNTDAAFNVQEKTAVSSVAAQLLQIWADLTDITTTAQHNLEKKITAIRRKESESLKDEYPKALKKREKLRESGQEMFDISHENYSIPSEDKEFFMNQKDRTKRSMSRPYSSPVSAGTSFLLNNGDGFSSPVSAGTSTNTSFQLDNFTFHQRIICK